MNDAHIDGLKDALKHSPDNVPLRLLLAESLSAANRLEEAEAEYTTLLRYSTETKIKVGLAGIYYRRNNFSACIVVLEDVLQQKIKDAAVYVLYARALLKDKAIAKAIEAYRTALDIDPKATDAELDAHLRSRGPEPGEAEDEEEESELSKRFLVKPDINFADVGGMENIKKEIDLKIIKPLQHAELYKAYGKKTGGGILLYGPPGCGKTYIAKATAGEVNAKFISIGLNDILDMWLGNSEKNLHAIFELARKNTPCVLFIDEIDALGASRSDMKTSSTRHLINQFLQELDGLEHSNEGVLVLGATNAPWSLDAAFRRPGRFDRIIFIPPPDQVSREVIFQLKLKSKPTETINCSELAKKSEHYSGADIDAVIDIAIEQKLEESFSTGVPKPLSTDDLAGAIKKHKPSTQEWFSTAKNFALFANEAGLYDEILHYLKLKK